MHIYINIYIYIYMYIICIYMNIVSYICNPIASMSVRSIHYR